MKNWLHNLFPTQQNTPTPAQQAVIDSRLRALELEISERDQKIAVLTAEIDRLHRQQEQMAQSQLNSTLESLFQDAASAVTQLHTQAYLLEEQNKPLQAQDILAVAHRIVRALEQHGLGLIHQVGEQTAFDPNRHTPLNNQAVYTPGQTVTVRFVGIEHQGKILRKAGVEKVETQP